MTNPAKKIIIGRFGKTYGIKGWLRVISFTDPPENILEYSDLQLENKNTWGPITITEYKLHSGQIIVKAKGYDDPETAKTLTNRKIAIERKQLPAIEQDEYYWTDLEGLTVIDQHDHELGKIDHLFATGANDVLVIRGDKEYLLPYIDDVVKMVDLANAQMIVDWEED